MDKRVHTGAPPTRSELRAWHLLAAEHVVDAMGSHAQQGLGSTAATERLAALGRNEIETASNLRVLGIFLAQFFDFMILVLLGAAAVSGILGAARDALAIVAIVVLNALIGTVQQYRAQRAIAALRKMAAPTARIMRGGQRLSIPSADVVPGDLLLLVAGDVVAADARLLTTATLQTDESALTGESRSVSKSSDTLEQEALQIGDRRNMVYRDTLVTRGNATAMVVATGAATEIGRIAELLRSGRDASTPLQIRIARFGRHLAVGILALCTVVFVIGLLQGQAPMLMFLTAVSLAVAAVPEALPAVVTVSLALGARRLTRRKALVRHLPAVEALGSVTFICADKTGTLTENRMTLGVAVAAGQRLAAVPTRTQANTVWTHVGQSIALNNDADLSADQPHGDPTEIALLDAAKQADFQRAGLLETLPRLATLPFDESRRRMATLHAADGRYLLYVKGAPEAVIARCTRTLRETGIVDFDPRAAQAEAETLAAEGFRVLALALRDFTSRPATLDADAVESELTFLGLVGLLDPPRPEARQAVADCISAGITPVMITGDHPETARNIAQRVGIAAEHTALLTGLDLDQLSDTELAQRVRATRVYARVNPEQKIRIVHALTDSGEFVAMTGDGVNDAPALRAAAIGIAMGKRGTDVAREAADMVLLDDNFATIVAAVREGRRIFDNIGKFIKYTMTSNAGEIWTLFLAPFLGLPLPLLPIHILWINLLTDGLPGLAFAAEPADPEIMQRPPRSPTESILSRGMWLYMLWMGLTIGVLSLSGQAWAMSQGDSHWQTMVFTILVLAQLFHALGVRSELRSLRQIGLASNPPLLAALGAMVVLQLMAIYVPAFNVVLQTQPLPAADLALCFGIASLTLVIVEAYKLVARRRLRRPEK
jgi:Ca2+-transporting ATPase